VPGPGGYRDVRDFGPEEAIVSAAVRGVSLPVHEVLG